MTPYRTPARHAAGREVEAALARLDQEPARPRRRHVPPQPHVAPAGEADNEIQSPALVALHREAEDVVAGVHPLPPPQRVEGRGAVIEAARRKAKRLAAEQAS